MKMLNKKGNVGALVPFIMSIVTVAIVITVGLIVMESVKANSTSATANTSIDTISTKLGSVASWIGILITVFMASAVLAYFYFKGN